MSAGFTGISCLLGPNKNKTEVWTMEGPAVILVNICETFQNLVDLAVGLQPCHSPFTCVRGIFMSSSTHIKDGVAASLCYL